MIKSHNDHSVDVGGQSGDNPADRSQSNGGSQCRMKTVIPGLETEWAISAARLEEKSELDARFTAIIAMIPETRQLIGTTIVAELEQSRIRDD